MRIDTKGNIQLDLCKRGGLLIDETFIMIFMKIQVEVILFYLGLDSVGRCLCKH